MSEKRFMILRVTASARDSYPNNFKVWVRVWDREKGKQYIRRGYGRFIGNFSPIWVSLFGKSYQLTELEHINVGDVL